MADQDAPDPQFDDDRSAAATRSASRAAEELNTTSVPGSRESWHGFRLRLQPRLPAGTTLPPGAPKQALPCDIPFESCRDTGEPPIIMARRTISFAWTAQTLGRSARRYTEAGDVAPVRPCCIRYPEDTCFEGQHMRRDH
jgi:hypothetical protein